MPVHYRQGTLSDVPAVAGIRSTAWGEEDYWHTRISGYLKGEHHPRHALAPRVLYVALHQNSVVGFVAGHLTRRYSCDGELEWINVIPAHRGTGVASELFRLLAGWFVEQNAKKICVDVDPANATARRFYVRHGATTLNPHWLVWTDVSVTLSANLPRPFDGRGTPRG
jgi:GNAT superfamily N-acetyltransferase